MSSRFAGALNPEGWLIDDPPPDGYDSWSEAESNGVKPGRFDTEFGEDWNAKDWNATYAKADFDATRKHTKRVPHKIGRERGMAETFSRCIACRCLVRNPHRGRCSKQKCPPNSFVAEDTRRFTTMMLRNIPESCTREELLSELRALEQIHGSRLFDFMYLPFDFKTRRPLGYAIVNATSNQNALVIWERFDGFFPERWNGRMTTMEWGTERKHHNRRSLMDFYKNSSIMHEQIPDEWKPIIFDHVGRRVRFPPPTKTIKLPTDFEPLDPAAGLLANEEYL